MFKNFLFLLFLLLFFLNFNVVEAVESIAEFEDYKIKISREKYKTEDIPNSNTSKDVFGIFKTLYYQNEQIDKKRINDESFYANGTTADVGSPYVAINNNGKAMIVYLRYLDQLRNRRPVAKIYNINTREFENIDFNLNSNLLLNNNVIEVGAIKDRFFVFYQETIFDYDVPDPDDFAWDNNIYFEVYNQIGDLIKPKTILESVSGSRLTNNIQLRLPGPVFEQTIDEKSIKKLNDNKLLVGIIIDDFRLSENKINKYVKVIDYEANVIGEKQAVEDFSFSEFINNINYCQENDWQYTVEPIACPKSGIQIKYWEKKSICEGGVNYPESEEISCQYIPEKPPCTLLDWELKVEPEGCPDSGFQTLKWIKKGDCVGGVEYDNNTWEESCIIDSEINIYDENLSERLAGKILLQVEENGEAWYLNPSNKKRSFMGRPDDAFKLMREQGIGITNSDLDKIPVSLDFLSGQDSSGDGLPDSFKIALGLDVNSIDSDGDGYCDFTELSHGYDPLGPGKLNYDLDFAEKQAGRILLQVERNGEAWYVNPENNKRYFLGRPSDAFNLMRNLGLGIKNSDLAKIEALRVDFNINKEIEVNNSYVDCGYIEYEDMVFLLFMDNYYQEDMTEKSKQAISCINQAMINCSLAKFKVKGTDTNPVFSDDEDFSVSSMQLIVEGKKENEKCQINNCLIPVKSIYNHYITNGKSFIFTLVGVSPQKEDSRVTNNDLYDPVTKEIIKEVCPVNEHIFKEIIN